MLSVLVDLSVSLSIEDFLTATPQLLLEESIVNNLEKSQ